MQRPEAQRSPCPVATALDLLGDRWTLLVVRDLMLGRQHFGEFLEGPERISTSTLTDRLFRLVEAGLVERLPSPTQPGRPAYRLTAAGAALRPVLDALTAWGLQHLPGTAAHLLPSPPSGPDRQPYPTAPEPLRS